jgi:hypothetical protein
MRLDRFPRHGGRLGAVISPCSHQLLAFLKHITPLVGSFQLIAGGMCQCGFGDLRMKRCLLRRPCLECRTKAVGRDVGEQELVF